MTYYRLEPDIYNPYDVIGEPRLPDGINFLSGRIIDVELPDPLVFRVNHPEEERPKHLLGGSVPVVSTLFVEVLRSAGVDNFQTFPALLRNEKTSVEWRGYHAFNAIGLIDAIVPGESSGEVIMPGNEQIAPLIDFTELVFDGRKTQRLLMFRLLQSPGDIFVQDTVKNRLLEMKPPEGWGITSYKVAVR